jgi:hypothetical protein
LALPLRGGLRLRMSPFSGFPMRPIGMTDSFPPDDSDRTRAHPLSLDTFKSRGYTTRMDCHETRHIATTLIVYLYKH